MIQFVLSISCDVVVHTRLSERTHFAIRSQLFLLKVCACTIHSLFFGEFIVAAQISGWVGISKVVYAGAKLPNSDGVEVVLIR